MSKTSSAKDTADKRRSTRLTLALPIKVRGVDALHEAFTEQTRTVMVSCHGCKYLSRHYVTKGSEVRVEIPRGDPKRPPRDVTAKVIWVQRPSHTREMLHIGLNLDVPGNVWDIPMPPDDWFPPPGEPAFVLEEPPPPPAPPPAPPHSPVTLTASWDASEILVMAGRAEGREAELTAALEMAKTQAAVATKEEIVRTEPDRVQRKADKQLYETMEEALKASMERLSESAVERIVERASAHMAQIVQEARRAYEVTTEQLDEKVHKAVRDALNGETGNKHGRSRRKR
ncbi:MAG TPA: PilZ domain-containing protein [Candidatus Acidoferrales bacterium]|nr:PilZ domain-containing protein [Candidatus Acidoferrales bacterium]